MEKTVYYVRKTEEIRFYILADSEEAAEEFVLNHSIADIASMTDDYASEDDGDVMDTIYKDTITEDDYAIDIRNGKEEE